MDEQSRRTNILVGDEVLVKIDDTKNVTHQNGVMKIEITTLPGPLNIGDYLKISWNAIDRALNFKYLQDDWKTVATKEDLTALAVDLSVLPETVKIGSTYVLGNVAGTLMLSDDGISGYEVSKQGHLHNSEMAGMTVLFPVNQDPPYWERCDGRAIERNTPQGENLVNLGCPYGTGDGTTTVTLPNLTAPAGFAYYMFIGYYS